MPKISILIPSYNINNKEYLKTAINSVLNQNFNKIELIIIDDNAKDDTPKILDKYASNDQRLIVIHKTKNEMTGYARNTGLDFVMGEYLGFLDYDDIIHPNALLFAYSEAKKKNFTVVHFDYKKFMNESNITKDLNDISNNYKTEKINENYSYPLGKIGTYVWSNIYKSSFILFHNFKFVNTWADEDVLFCINIFSYKFDILIIKKKLIYHRLLSTSVGHNTKHMSLRKKLYLFHLKNIFKNWAKKGMMKERLIENSFILLIKSFFKKDINTFIKFLKSYKDIFSENIIREKFIKIFKTKNIEQLYSNKELNINKYEHLISRKKKCYI